MSDETEVINYRVLWERDSAALGRCIQEIHTLLAIKEDQRAKIAHLERELNEIHDNLRRRHADLTPEEEKNWFG